MTLFFWFHRFLTADDIAGVNTPADLIHRDNQAAHSALVGIALLHTLLGNFLRYFLCSHNFLLSNSPYLPLETVSQLPFCHPELGSGSRNSLN